MEQYSTTFYNCYRTYQHPSITPCFVTLQFGSGMQRLYFSIFYICFNSRLPPGVDMWPLYLSYLILHMDSYPETQMIPDRINFSSSQERPCKIRKSCSLKLLLYDAQNFFYPLHTTIQKITDEWLLDSFSLT